MFFYLKDRKLFTSILWAFNLPHSFCIYQSVFLSFTHLYDFLSVYLHSSLSKCPYIFTYLYACLSLLSMLHSFINLFYSSHFILSLSFIRWYSFIYHSNIYNSFIYSFIYIYSFTKIYTTNREFKRFISYISICTLVT